MSEPIKFTIEPFSYVFSLDENVLRIDMKHLDECFIWSAIIEDTLEDPDNIKCEVNPKKQFVANVEPEELFDIFSQFKKGILDKNIKITFPTMFKNENEHLCIFVDFQRSYGKQKNDTKYIIVKPENIAKDIIMFEKLEHLRSKTSTKFSEIEKSMTDHKDESHKLSISTKEELENNYKKEIETLKSSLLAEMKNERDDFIKKLANLESKVMSQSEIKYQPLLTSELSNINQAMTKLSTDLTLLQTKTTNDMTTMQNNILAQCTTKFHPKITTELTALQTTIMSQTDAKYQPKLTNELPTLQNTIIQLCDTKYQTKT